MSRIIKINDDYSSTPEYIIVTAGSVAAFNVGMEFLTAIESAQAERINYVLITSMLNDVHDGDMITYTDENGSQGSITISNVTPQAPSGLRKMFAANSTRPATVDRLYANGYIPCGEGQTPIGFGGYLDGQTTNTRLGIRGVTDELQVGDVLVYWDDGDTGEITVTNIVSSATPGGSYPWQFIIDYSPSYNFYNSMTTSFYHVGLQKDGTARVSIGAARAILRHIGN